MVALAKEKERGYFPEITLILESYSYKKNKVSISGKQKPMATSKPLLYQPLKVVFYPR